MKKTRNNSVGTIEPGQIASDINNASGAPRTDENENVFGGTIRTAKTKQVWSDSDPKFAKTKL